jgi:hypothetical protein
VRNRNRRISLDRALKQSPEHKRDKYKGKKGRENARKAHRNPK